VKIAVDPAVREAVDACPNLAISIVEGE